MKGLGVRFFVFFCFFWGGGGRYCVIVYTDFALFNLFEDQHLDQCEWLQGSLAVTCWLADEIPDFFLHRDLCTTHKHLILKWTYPSFLYEWHGLYGACFKRMCFLASSTFCNRGADCASWMVWLYEETEFYHWMICLTCTDTGIAKGRGHKGAMPLPH